MPSVLDIQGYLKRFWEFLELLVEMMASQFLSVRYLSSRTQCGRGGGGGTKSSVLIRKPPIFWEISNTSIYLYMHTICSDQNQKIYIYFIIITVLSQRRHNRQETNYLRKPYLEKQKNLEILSVHFGKHTTLTLNLITYVGCLINCSA